MLQGFTESFLFLVKPKVDLDDIKFPMGLLYLHVCVNDLPL